MIGKVLVVAVHWLHEFFPIGYMFERAVFTGGILAGVTAAVVVDQQAPKSAPGFLFLLTLGAMTVELLSCYLSKPRAEKKEHNWSGAFTGKLFIIFLGVCALLLDGVLHQAPYMFPEIDFEVLGEGYFPITTASMVWFVIAEVTRAVNNIRKYEGDDSTIPIVILMFLKKVHAIDDKRAEAAGVGPHQTRLIDQLTPQQIADIMADRVPEGLPPVIPATPSETGEDPA